MAVEGNIDTPLMDLQRVGQMTGLSINTITSFVNACVVSPVRRNGHVLGFTFRDMVLLRTAQALREAHLPTRRIVRALARLRHELPDTLPLTGLQICAVGDVVAVREGAATREVESGQWVLGFDNDIVGTVAQPMSHAQVDPAGPGHNAALDWFDHAVTQEQTDSDAAESAYRHAITLDPCFEDAYVNLGAMLCEAHRSDDAVALFMQAARHCQDAPLVHFNHAVALDDQGKANDALRSYEAALRCDPSLADAHFNIAALLERAGDSRGALRHLNAYRRMQHDPLVQSGSE